MLSFIFFEGHLQSIFAIIIFILSFFTLKFNVKIIYLIAYFIGGNVNIGTD
jgi:hypothetical protein